MGYDRGDSFPFEFEPNGILFVSKSKGRLSPRSYPIQCEMKWKYSFLSERSHNIGYNMRRPGHFNNNNVRHFCGSMGCGTAFQFKLHV